MCLRIGARGPAAKCTSVCAWCLGYIQARHATQHARMMMCPASWCWDLVTCIWVGGYLPACLCFHLLHPAYPATSSFSHIVFCVYAPVSLVPQANAHHHDDHPVSQNHVCVRYAPQVFADPTTTTHSYASQGCYTVSARALEAPNSGPSSIPSKNMAQSSTWARVVKVCRHATHACTHACMQARTHRSRRSRRNFAAVHCPTRLPSAPHHPARRKQAGAGPFTCRAPIQGLINGSSYPPGATLALPEGTTVTLSFLNMALLPGWPYTVTAQWGVDGVAPNVSSAFTAPLDTGDVVPRVSLTYRYATATPGATPYLLGAVAGARPAGSADRDWEVRVWVSAGAAAAGAPLSRAGPARKGC